MRWISVKDNLPEKFEDVLCYSEKNGGYFFIGYVGNDSSIWHKNGLIYSYDVTHWTPLIKP